MMLGINTNVASLTAQKNLSMSGAGLDTAIARLSSGLR
ncbi:flagellin FliC, partial [Limnobacter humi]|nr:flagellin FliC [Limnobacter humi]MCQ8897390.1 flagellin FliC [Limnobacter humi]